MTQPNLGAASVWVLIVVLGLGTFALRLSFIQLYGLLDEFPPRVERGLTFVPAAILAALVCAELFTLDGSVVGTIVNVRVFAAALATLVAWRTRSMLATIAVGMAALYVVQAAFG